MRKINKYIFLIYWKWNIHGKLNRFKGFIVKGLPDILLFLLTPSSRWSHRQGIRCQEGGCPVLVSDVKNNFTFTNVSFRFPEAVYFSRRYSVVFCCRHLPENNRTAYICLCFQPARTIVSQRVSWVANGSLLSCVASLLRTYEIQVRPLSDVYER